MAETKVKPPFVRSAYNYDTNAASDESGLSCPEPTLAQQQFAEESDINYIAERYGLTGEMPQVLELPRYGNFEGIFDFQSAQDAVVLAKQQFMTLPAKVRSRFDNDPQKLLAFMEDPDNRQEAEFMGLISKPETPTAAPGEPEGGKPPSDPPKGTPAAATPQKTDT